MTLAVWSSVALCRSPTGAAGRAVASRYPCNASGSHALSRGPAAAIRGKQAHVHVISGLVLLVPEPSITNWEFGL
jgi:hypothetical protein